MIELTNKCADSQSLAEKLALYCTTLSLDDVPEEVVTHARFLFLDLMGAALAGVDTPEARSASSAVRMMAPDSGFCTIWGTPYRTTPTGAALINGISAHARELDDFGGVDHSGAVVIPAVLAVVEANPVISGTRLLEAIIVGYEVGRRVLSAAGGYRPHNHEEGWHSTGTCGSFAAAAAVSKALDLDARQSTWALGLAGSFTGGTWAFAKDGAMSKRYHVGRAAETGVVSAYLARNGFTGPAYIFEAEWGGFFETYTKVMPSPDKLVQNLGESYGILRSGIKPYAACRDIHSTLDVVLNAKRKHDLTPGEIDKIKVRCTPESLQMVGKIAFPKTRLEAQLSLPYSIGVALAAGQAGLSEYEQPMLKDSEVNNIARRVQLITDPGLPSDSEPYVTIITTDSRCIEGHVEYASGAWQNPLSPDVLIEKFETLASRTIPLDQSKRLKEHILSIESLGDMRRIVECLSILPGITPLNGTKGKT